MPDKKIWHRVVEVTDSEPIERLAYNHQDKVLRVWFKKTGTVWDYHGVYPGDFALVVSAYSVGQEFNARIRDRFDAIRVDEAEGAVRPASKPHLYRENKLF